MSAVFSGVVSAPHSVLARSPLDPEAMSCLALIWRSQCAPLWREKRDSKMLPGKTFVVLAAIHQFLRLQVQAFAALSVLCCPRSSGAGMPVVWLAFGEEANLRVQLSWP